MRWRQAWIACFLAFTGCHSLAVPRSTVDADAADTLWQEGQRATREGQFEIAIRCYEASLEADPAYAHNHLSLAAAHLELGHDAQACVHLGRYLACHPQQASLRFRYAELLLRLDRPQEACREFNRFVSDAQDERKPDWAPLIHSSGRLLELAERAGDAYAAHLHRGLGLYFLACNRADLPDPGGELSSESLLFKAVSELMRAHELRPDEARPCCYLYESWRRLAQPDTAKRWLGEALAAAPFSELTPAEHRRLRLVSGEG